MNSIKNIAIENNEAIFKLKNDIDALKILNTTTLNIQGDIDILKYIHGEAFPIQGEEATQVISSTPAIISPSIPPQNLTNTITYTSKLAILPFNFNVYDSLGYSITNIYFNHPLNIDSTLIIYFFPFQYTFNRITSIQTNKQITYIDLRKSPMTVSVSSSFPLNSTQGVGFDYDFTKLVFWMRKNNSMCFISDIVKQN